MNDYKNFSSRLHTAREYLRGFTQVQLAKKAAIPVTTISHFEIGTRKPSFGNLIKLADALDVTTDYLLGRSNDPINASMDPNDLYRNIKFLTHKDKELIEFMIKKIWELK